MKLASLKDGRDGRLIVVDKAGTRYLPATGIAPTLQSALDRWQECHQPLLAMSQEVNDGKGFTLDSSELDAPLPRAYEWLDGSAFLNHVELVRKARGAKPPETLRTDPLVYQGGSGVLLGPRDPIELVDASWGLDFEGEICVILGDIARGTSKEAASDGVRLIMLCNDVSLRNLIPAELAKGFGFVNSKPSTAFSPFAVTPDELGESWQEGRVRLNLRVRLNGSKVGDVNAGPEMHFSFFDLIAHIARTRSFCSGTILGSGTVSNADPQAGISCLAERRMRETLAEGKPTTEFLQLGDRIEIEMFDAEGTNLFGTISQVIVKGK